MVIVLFVDFFILERNIDFFFQTYFCIHWLILECALTGYRTYNLACGDYSLTNRATHQSPFIVIFNILRSYVIVIGWICRSLLLHQLTPYPLTLPFLLWNGNTYFVQVWSLYIHRSRTGWISPQFKLIKLFIFHLSSSPRCTHVIFLANYM